MASDATGAPRAATIHEVARRAGVSHQTVSRYLRDMGPFKPATTERVEKAIQELNYRPNMIARSMRTRRTGVLAVILPSQVDAMPTPTLAGAARAAHAAGCFMEISVVDGTAQDRASRAVELMESGRVDGVLSLSALPGLRDRPKGPGTAALAVLGQFDDDLRGIGPLADASIMADIVKHLAEIGHRNFLHISGPQDWTSARARRKVFEETVAELGLVSCGIVGGGWGPEVGYSTISELAPGSTVTAVVAANDYVAMGAVRAAHERGWRVPQDLSVIGWDNLETGRYATPSLSTVAVDREGQGWQAMSRLIALVRDESSPLGSPEANRLILRESCGPPPT